MTSAPSARRLAVLRRDVARLQRLLDERFDPPVTGERRLVRMTESGQYVGIRNFPLPDGFEPDHADVLVPVERYPAAPPLGLHVHHRGAVAFIDFTICSWRYCVAAPERGDDLCSYVAAFFAVLEQTVSAETSKPHFGAPR